MPDAAALTLAFIIAIGLTFDFINGFHDTANAIATTVATRVLTPFQAIGMAAVLNVLGALSGTAVATTVGKGIVPPEGTTQLLVISALFSAIIWDLVTWYYGIPSSSSHALVFSIVGAGAAALGWGSIQFSGTSKVLQGLVISPVGGLLGAYLLLILLFWLLARARPQFVARLFGRAQVVSSAYMAFSHGGNDAQKTMGIMTMALAAYYGWSGSEWQVPLWIILSAATAMGLGTATGGWRIIKTMGHRVVELRPIDGFAAETAAATVIEVASRLGIPISTTHVISTAIMGVGAAKRIKAVRWSVAGTIVTAWILTIPVCIGMSYLTYTLINLITGIR